MRGKRGGGRRQAAGRGFGPGGDCVCQNCGHREKHTIGTPCYNMKCPKCGAMMTRGS